MREWGNLCATLRIDRIMTKKGKATEDLLNSLHEAVANTLLKRIEAGEVSAQELNAAIKFLKDNGIEADVRNAEDMSALARIVLPSFNDDEDGVADSLN